ncbi:MAG: protein-disulfide reductase DsbD domain-containing protein [Roseinatronobacter sp.]
MKICRALALIAACLAGTALHAKPPRVADILNAQTRAGWMTEGGSYVAGLHLRLAQNWITYWRHPGEAGVVPRLDWSGSENVAEARIIWPEPQLHMKSGFASIGYAEDVLLPIEITPLNPGQPATLNAVFQIGVCDDICIPVDLPVTIPIGTNRTPDRVLAAALGRQPRRAQAEGLRGIECAFTPDRRNLRVRTDLDLPATGAREFVLIEMPGMPSRGLPTERMGQTLVGHGLIRTEDGRGIDRSALRVSVVSERGTVVHQGCSVGP